MARPDAIELGMGSRTTVRLIEAEPEDLRHFGICRAHGEEDLEWARFDEELTLEPAPGYGIDREVRLADGWVVAVCPACFEREFDVDIVRTGGDEQLRRLLRMYFDDVERAFEPVEALTADERIDQLVERVDELERLADQRKPAYEWAGKQRERDRRREVYTTKNTP